MTARAGVGSTVRPGARRPSAGLLSVIVVGASLILACGGRITAEDESSASSIATGPTSSTTAGPPTMSPSAPPSSAATSPNAAVLVDPDLLAILPESIDGVALEPDPETAAEIARDPTLGGAAAAIAVASAIEATGTAEDAAIVSVVQLRPGVFSEAFFGQWRTSYDTAACEPAGGVAGVSESEIGEQRVHVGRCVGGPMTYHVRLPGDRLLAITSLGEREFGAMVVAALR